MQKRAFNKVPGALMLCFLLLTVSAAASYAQNRKVIFLKDKNLTPYSLSNPQQFISQRALDRRTRYNIAIDSSDLPVNPDYISVISAFNNVRVIGSSKWLNAVIVECSDADILAQINNLPFVKTIESVALRTGRPGSRQNAVETITSLSPFSGRITSSHTDTLNYGPAADQIRMHNGQLLHNIGAQGEGMLIAFFDAGYYQFNSNRFIDSARLQGRILATKDFYEDDDQVDDDDAHGLYCLSAVAGNIPGEYVGSSPKASFLLLKTEDVKSEQIIEEYMWGLGAEYADSCGADVFSSSVGYTTFDDPAQNHNYNELNGNTAIVTRMADKAASKGILVITSAGNEGGSGWKYIGTPADGDSVFAVGAVNIQKQIAGFSSFGPTVDGKIKPNGVSVGLSTALIGTNQSVIYANGTSFSTPNLAGIMTCLWQLFPELNNYEMMQLVQESSDRYLSPDAQYGYGIPDMAKAIAIWLQKKSITVIELNDCDVKFNWKSRDKKGMGYIIQRKFDDQLIYTTLDTIFSNSTIWGESNYLYSDPSVPRNAVYRIIQVLDTSKTAPLFFTLDSFSITVPDLCREKVDDLPDLISRSSIVIFPNPAKNHFNITFSSKLPVQHLQLKIYNASGQCVKQVQLSKPSGLYTTPAISLTDLTKGVYLLDISENHNRISTYKLLIQ